MKISLPVRTLLCFSAALSINCANTVRAEDSVATAGLENDGVSKQPAVHHPESPTYLRDVLPIFMGKCARCHGDPASVLPCWLDYQTAFTHRLELERRVWHSWKGSYYKQPMPAGNSLEAQSMTETERLIVKHWVEEGAQQGVPSPDSGLHSKADRMELGKRMFGAVCAVCHQSAGQGVASRFPPVAGSDYLNADKHRAITIVVNGLQGELTVNGQKFNGAMPKFPLSDPEIANVLTYVYNSMGNSGQEITADEVRAARAEKSEPGMAGQMRRAPGGEAKNPFE